MNKYINQVVSSALLISLPMQVPASICTHESTFLPENNIVSLLTSAELTRYGLYSDFNQVLDLINALESGALEEIDDPELINVAISIVTDLARKGILPDGSKDEATLEQDIEELLQDATFELSSNDYLVFPAVFYGKDQNILLCKSWLKKKCEQVAKFVKHHKKEILIAAAIAVAVAAAAIAAATIACAAATTAAGAAAASADPKKSEPKEKPEPILPPLSEFVQEQTVSFKELIVEENLLQKQPNKPLGEKARELGSYLAHEIIEGVAELALIIPENIQAAGHEKIDQIFSTNIGFRWSKEVKENALMNNFNIGIIPLPGLLAGQKETVKIAASEVSAVKGWKLGDRIQNLTAAGEVPTWTTVRRRVWKNKAHYSPENYELLELERMKKGLAPQKYNQRTKQLESKELHHIPPQREGNLFNVIELWPDEHALADTCRKIGK